MFSRRLLVMAGLVVAAAVASAAQMSDSDHVKEVAEWRAKHEADYTREWVPLAGLFYLQPGDNAAGSAAANPIKLPSRAPASIGRFMYRDKHVTFEPRAGAPVTLKGQPVTSGLVLRSD